MKQVLVADDSETTRNLMGDIIKVVSDDLQPVFCADATEAVEQLLHPDKFLVIVTDWNMPGGGGRRVLEEARLVGFPMARVIVMTGDGISADQALTNLEQAGQFKVGGKFRKPFAVGEVCDLLSKLL